MQSKKFCERRSDFGIGNGFTFSDANGRFFLFCRHAKPIFHCLWQYHTKTKVCHSCLQNYCSWFNFVFVSQTKAHEEPKFSLCKFFRVAWDDRKHDTLRFCISVALARIQFNKISFKRVNHSEWVVFRSQAGRIC